MTSPKKPYNYDFLNSQELNEREPDYEKAELDLLREGLRRTFKERLLFTTMLYKLQFTLRDRITIVHKPYNLDK